MTRTPDAVLIFAGHLQSGDCVMLGDLVRVVDRVMPVHEAHAQHGVLFFQQNAQLHCWVAWESDSGGPFGMFFKRFDTVKVLTPQGLDRLATWQAENP